MSTFSLLSVSIWGFFWLALLFALCFGLILLIKLAKLGRAYQKQQSNPKEQEKTDEKESPSAQKTEEPIYYIVERKKRVKSTFSQPKQIRFK